MLHGNWPSYNLAMRGAHLAFASLAAGLSLVACGPDVVRGPSGAGAAGMAGTGASAPGAFCNEAILYVRDPPQAESRNKSATSVAKAPYRVTRHRLRMRTFSFV